MKNIEENKVDLEKKTAIVLGGTTPHINLLKKLKALDYITVLVDYFEAPKAKQYADIHIQESTLDQEKILEIAKKYKVALVISTCIDQANSVACYVAEQMGLTSPYSYKISCDVTNKKLMKAIFEKNEIPTAKYINIKKGENIPNTDINYPVVVKPVDCNSSKGVYKVEEEKNLEEYLKNALEFSRTSCAIVEEFKDGIEIQVDCLSYMKDVKVLMTRQKKKLPNCNGQVINSMGSVIPAELSEVCKVQIQKIAEKIAYGFKLKNTPFFYQAIVKGDEVSVLEFAPRLGGGLSSFLLPMYTGVDMINISIDSWLNKEIIANIEKNIYCYSTILIYGKQGVFNRISNLEELKLEGKIVEYFIYKLQGEVISSDKSSGNRVGAVILKSDNRNSLKDLEQEVMERIKVLDMEGENILYNNY